MKTKEFVKVIYSLLATTILISGCASTTLFRTTPEGSDIYVNGEKRGITPYYYSDSKIVFSSTPITFRKAGYRDLNVILKRNERANGDAILAGIVCYVPFLWSLEYNPTHSYEMEPIYTGEQLIEKNTEINNNIVSNNDSLYSRLNYTASGDSGHVNQDNTVNNDTISAKSIQKSVVSNGPDSLVTTPVSNQRSGSYKPNDFSAMNAEQLNHCLNNARIMRNTGIVLYVAGGLSIGSAFLISIGVAGSIIYDPKSDTDRAMNLATGLVIGGSVAVVTGIPLAVVGASRRRRIEVYLQNLKVKTTNGMAGGLGVTLRF